MGNRSSIRFTEKDIPPQTGKTVLITGANSGIGFQAAKQLAQHGAHVIMTGRNAEKLQDAAKKVSDSAKTTDLGKNSKVDTAVVNLASMTSITSFAEEIKSKYSKIDTLISNAGVFVTPFSKTEQGFEVTLGTNGIGTTYLTNLLLPLVLKSDEGRVVVVSSEAVNFVSSSAFNRYIKDIGGESATKTTLEIYGMSKLMNAFYARELQKQFDAKGYKNIFAISLHPGAVNTEIKEKTSDALWLTIGKQFFTLIALTPEVGALSTLFAATSKDASSFKGELISPGPNISRFYISSSAYTNENSEKTFAAMNEVIVKKGFSGFSI